jgi:CRP-like cAMP-binding protein
VNDVALVLDQTVMFSTASSETLERLQAASHGRTVSKGSFVFHEGEPGDEIFIVVEGLVKLSCTSRDGGEVAFGTVGRRGSFGELSALDGQPRSAAARTIRNTVLTVLPGSAVRAALRDDAALASSLLRFMAERLRATTRQHAELVFVDLPGRVARYLLEGVERSSSDRLDLDISQGDLAALLGASRQSVNQVLRAFECEGVITRHGPSIEILDTRVLAYRAEGIPT